MTARLRSWLGTIFRRTNLEREMRDELDFHIQTRVDHLIRAGLSREDALRRARLNFGGLEGWKERCRDARGAALVDEIVRNVRDSLRSVRRSPAFVAIALLSLALGIGANVAMFGLVRQLLLSPLPVREPGRLHQVVLSTVRQPYYAISYPKFKTLGAQFPIFESLFGWGSQGEGDVVAADRTETGRVTLVTGSFFEGLGVRPAIGRLIVPDDDRPGGAADVAVLSDRLWRRLFDRDPRALTRSITIRDLHLQVIGVAPPEFLGAEPSDPTDVYVPVHAMQPTRPGIITAGGAMWMHVMARLKPDVPTEKAQIILHDGWSEIDRATQAGRGDNTRPEFLMLEDGSHGFSRVRIDFSGPVVVLMVLVGIVFLITCANLASLLFVRATRRAGELSVRIALGAGRAQLVRQWLTESLLLAFAGGFAGLVVARWMTDVLLEFVPEETRASLRFHASFQVLAFSIGLTILAGFLFGCIPALRASRMNAHEALKAHGPSVASRRGHVAQMVLAGQLAASLVLVVGAVLFARTLWKLNNQSTGFDRETVVYAGPQFFRQKYTPDQASAAMDQIIQTLRHSPHVASVAVGGPPILWGGAGTWNWARVPGYAFAPDENNVVFFFWASSGYFQTMGIPFVAGRDFEERDAQEAPGRDGLVIVNEKLARHYFAGRSPIGQRIAFGARKPVEIVGVVRDVIDKDLRTPPKDLAYYPMATNEPGTILVRAVPGLDPRAAETELRSAITAAARNLPIESGRMEDAIQASLTRDRLVTELSAAFGVLGVLLASIGLFGAIAHWAGGRTREVGIRMALGATRWDIARMVFTQSLSVTGLGIAVGVPLALVAAKLIEPLLFGVSSKDVVALVTSSLILGSAGLLAACWPARRAARLDPLQALRDE